MSRKHYRIGHLEIDVFESSVDTVRELGDRSGVSWHSIDSHNLKTSRLDDACAHLDDQRYILGERGRRTEFEGYFESGPFWR